MCLYLLVNTLNINIKTVLPNRQNEPKSSKNQVDNFIERRIKICNYPLMVIIIDGYNLIRQSSKLRRYELYSLQAGRQALMSRLSDYQQKKGHKITVIFDGWQGEEREEERDRHNNVDIIYSRFGEDADTVIKRLAAQSEEETVVVSSDREIASFAASLGNTVLSSVEFESVMNRAITSLPSHNYINAADDSGKTDRKRKRGPSRKLSKAQKNMQKIMRRL